ncbi:MAG TPA: hypothetical protein VJ746_03060, partial [Nitrospira sp.]|nr:hypothetical protein [Nitrospira sp.]
MPAPAHSTRPSLLSYHLAPIVLTGVLSGCTALETTSRESEFERRCRPVEHVPGGTLFPSLSKLPQLSMQEATELSKATGFSPLSVEAAHAFDSLEELKRIPTLEKAMAEQQQGSKEALREIRTTLIERILLVSFQNNSVNAEIACEAARAEQLADHLQQHNEDRARLLTIMAVVAGGVAAIAVGGLAIAEHAVAEGIAGIIGGTLSTAFGTAALFQNREYPFRHPRNLLREIWDGPPTPVLFPDVIWRFLNRPLEENPSTTLRTAIIERWRSDGRLGKPGSALEKRRMALLFAEGGNYNVDDLRARAQMLNLLQSQVALTNEYLEQFLRELLSRP